MLWAFSEPVDTVWVPSTYPLPLGDRKPLWEEATFPVEGEMSLSWVPAVTFLMMRSQTNCIDLFITGLEAHQTNGLRLFPYSYLLSK